MFHIESGLIRFTGAAVCAAAGLLFIMPFGLGIKNIGNIFGLIIAVIFFAFFTFNSRISSLLASAWTSVKGKIIISAVCAFFVLGFACAAVISGFMVKAVLNTPSEPRPAVLLGCKVRGTQPSLMLGRRLDAAFDYLENFPDTVIVVSGGQGPGEDISEAQCMKNNLVGRGISEDRIIMEDRSTDTAENMKFSKKLLDDINAGDEVVIITDSFHQFRASLIARKNGLSAQSVSAETPVYLLPTYWVREWFGVIEQLIF